MKSFEELFEIARKLEVVAENGASDTIDAPLSSLKEAATNIGRSFSGSWLGYHSCVYYNGFEPKPPGANFSQEWGLKDLSITSLGSRGDWREYSRETVIGQIYRLAGNPEIEASKDAGSAA